MSNITVTHDRLHFGKKSYRCAIGKGGFSANKKEGDGCTPIGTFALRECWYRADRIVKPKTKLPLRIIHENDGWCDDPASEDYNRHFVLTAPPASGGDKGGERLWRDDGAYDLIVPLGYNDDPVVAGKGSAIFLHVMHDDARPTEGCIALAKPDLLAILPAVDTHTIIEIKE